MNGKFGRTKERLDELMLYGTWIGVSSISQVAWWKWRKCSGRRCFFISNLIFYFSLKLLRENHDFSLKVAATGGKKFHVIFFFRNRTTHLVTIPMRFLLFLSFRKKGEIVQKNMSAVTCYSVWTLLRKLKLHFSKYRL